MIRIIWACLTLSLALKAQGAEFILAHPTPAAPYTVAANQPSTLTAYGIPLLPVGTVLTITAAKTADSYRVFVISPIGHSTELAKGIWSATFTIVGGYRLQVGLENLELLAPMEFIIGKTEQQTNAR